MGSKVVASSEFIKSLDVKWWDKVTGHLQKFEDCEAHKMLTDVVEKLSKENFDCYTVDFAKNELSKFENGDPSHHWKLIVAKDMIKNIYDANRVEDNTPKELVKPKDQVEPDKPIEAPVGMTIPKVSEKIEEVKKVEEKKPEVKKEEVKKVEEKKVIKEQVTRVHCKKCNYIWHAADPKQTESCTMCGAKGADLEKTAMKEGKCNSCGSESPLLNEKLECQVCETGGVAREVRSVLMKLDSGAAINDLVKDIMSVE